MSDYLPYGKLNEGVEHVDICVSVALPKTRVKGCAVHLASDDNMDVVWKNDSDQELHLINKLKLNFTCLRLGAVQTV